MILNDCDPFYAEVVFVLAPKRLQYKWCDDRHLLVTTSFAFCVITFEIIMI